MTVRNIVFVDDDPEDSEFFATAVHEIYPHIRIIVASDKSEILVALEQQTPDVLFIDSFIQNSSGTESIREIRERSEFADLPIIMYTGADDVKHIQNAFDAGATGYVVKPHSLSEIKRVIRLMLEENWNQPVRQYYLNGAFHPLK